MARHAIALEPGASLAEEPGTGHNRWHPDIAPVLVARPGDEVVLETRDALDGQIGPSATAADVRGLDVSRVHPLTGPVFVEGAEPGDVLEVEVLEVATDSFGYTVQSPGFGFLRDELPEPFVARWAIAGGRATSDDVPGVRIRGDAFMGVVGVAPSHELLERAAARERALHDAGGFADLPEPHGAVPADPSIAGAALRTIAPRENAGNIDVKQLVAGARILIPVWAPGALLSVGDAHFAQGDGEVCGQAIEVRATFRARLGLRKGEARERGIDHLRFTGVARPSPSGRYFATTGICLERDGANAGEDLTLAARNAVRAMVDHLGATYGYTREQAYAICSVAVDLRVSQAVDLPNVLVSAFLPLDIFDASTGR